MAAPKLNTKQRHKVIEWVAAGVPTDEIKRLAKEKGFPQLSTNSISYYRRTYAPEIATAGDELSKHIEAGLAVREERIRQLCEYAEELKQYRLIQDENGRLVNSKEWRDTLRQISDEMDKLEGTDQSSETPQVNVSVNLGQDDLLKAAWMELNKSTDKSKELMPIEKVLSLADNEPIKEGKAGK